MGGVWNKGKTTHFLRNIMLTKPFPTEKAYLITILHLHFKSYQEARNL